MLDLELLKHEPRVTTDLSMEAERNIPGSNKVAGLIDLLQYVEDHTGEPLRLAIEIGSYRGVSTEALLHFFDNVIAVDPWPPNLSRAKREFDARFSVEMGMSYLRMGSIEAAKLIADGVADFVYIDADHAYSSLLADIKAWLPKVKLGGWIGGHDYHEDILDGDVCRAVNNVFIMPDHVFSDTSWLYWKKAS